MYTCMYACLYVYVCMHACMYVHTHDFSEGPSVIISKTDFKAFSINPCAISQGKDESILHIVDDLVVSVAWLVWAQIFVLGWLVPDK